MQDLMLNIENNPHFTASSKCIEEEQKKNSAKTVMKLETGSSKGLHENEVQQGVQHFSPFPGSWHHTCQRLKVALCSVDCLKNRHRTGPTKSLSAASYSGGTGGKTLLLLVWRWRREWKTFQGITEGSIPAWAPQGPFANADHGVWKLVGTGRSDQED